MTEMNQDIEWMGEPWKKSRLTRIWDVTEKARHEAGTQHPADDASLAVWLVHAPWMHFAWSWHYVSLIHLRDLPGQSRSPTLAFPEATHEFIVFAVDPDSHISFKDRALKFLSPVSIVQQFTAKNDAQALSTIEDGLTLTLPGQFTLDSDGRQQWRGFLMERVV